MIDFPFFTLLQKDAPLPDNLLDTAHNFLGLAPNPRSGKEHREKMEPEFKSPHPIKTKW